jgi:hypothetical protein
METKTAGLAFVLSKHHASESALDGGDGTALPFSISPPPLHEHEPDVGGGGLAHASASDPPPSSSTTRVTPLSAPATVTPPGHLSTYTAGEDGGRLASMAKEFGLARTRLAKAQVRRHTFTVS